MKDRVCVGAIAGSFGVKGEVRLKSFCANAPDIASYGPLTSEDGSTSHTITLTRPIKSGFAARLSGIASKDAADALRGTRLYAARGALPTLPDDEFYHSDLIGLSAVDTGGAPLGKVAAIQDHGAGDILELRGAPLKESLLVPFTRSTAPTIDLRAGRIVIDPPDGLLED